jgi:hypothetical protein
MGYQRESLPVASPHQCNSDRYIGLDWVDIAIPVVCRYKNAPAYLRFPLGKAIDCGRKSDRTRDSLYLEFNLIWHVRMYNINVKGTPMDVDPRKDISISILEEF